MISHTTQLTFYQREMGLRNNMCRRGSEFGVKQLTKGQFFTWYAERVKIRDPPLLEIVMIQILAYYLRANVPQFNTERLFITRIFFFFQLRYLAFRSIRN